jgi:hypothetical protein
VIVSIAIGVQASAKIDHRRIGERHNRDAFRVDAVTEQRTHALLDGRGLARSWSGDQSHLRRVCVRGSLLDGLRRLDVFES